MVNREIRTVVFILRIERPSKDKAAHALPVGLEITVLPQFFVRLTEGSGAGLAAPELMRRLPQYPNFLQVWCWRLVQVHRLSPLDFGGEKPHTYLGQ